MSTTTIAGRDPIEGYLAHIRLAGMRQSTIYYRRLGWYNVQEWAGVRLLDMTEDQIDTWQRMNGHLAANTRRGRVAHLRCFFQWAQRCHLRFDDPTHVLITPRKPRSIPRPISESDLAMALETAAPNVRAILILAAYCGLRAARSPG